jgi:hypothetical protein
MHASHLGPIRPDGGAGRREIGANEPNAAEMAVVWGVE